MRDISILRERAVQQGKRLEYFTIAWNTLEGIIAIVAGGLANSIPLVGFGIDSFIEVTSGSALLWRVTVDRDELKRERNERLSLKIVGGCFLGLSAYIAYESISDLVLRRGPERSIPGVILACVSLIAMPLLSRAKVARWEGTGQRSDACRCASDGFLFLFVLDFARGFITQRDAGMVVGRSACSSQYGPNYRS